MNKFEKVKLYYEKCLWDKSRVRNAVVKGWITAEEYESITGEPYKKSVITEEEYKSIVEEETAVGGEVTE